MQHLSSAGSAGRAATFLALLSFSPTALALQAQEAVGAQPRLCGCPDFSASAQFFAGSPSDCAYGTNLADDEYDPGFVMEIPVVFHVISRTNGQGDISDQAIINQMAHMNDSFAGALDVNGVDSMIRFVLASEDPQGQPTNGITRTVNNTWFNDAGNYASQLSWDSNRYLNVFTLQPFGSSGVIGYVPDLPQGGIVGTANDGVRMLYSAIDSNTFRHVLSHEVGHHFGLYHTFGGNCINSNCQTQGDLICDTNPHPSPTNTCAGNPGACGMQPQPRNNFMNYQDIACVWEFTLGQIQRMRCTLENWRPDLWETPNDGVGMNYCTASVNSTGSGSSMSGSGSASVAANDLVLEAVNVPVQPGLFYYGSESTLVPFGNGFRCVAGGSSGIARLGVITPDGSGNASFSVDLTAPPTMATTITPGSTWYFQLWYRDPAAGGASFNLSDGLEVSFLP